MGVFGAGRLAAVVGTMVLVIAGPARAAPTCGEATCQPIAGTSFSHYMGLDCTGLEYHYPVYNGTDLRPYSWDGGGLGGTATTTANPLSFRAVGGACTNRAVTGDLAGLLRVYRCAAGEVQCGSTCLPSGQCCTANDCGLVPAHATPTCTGGQCGFTCSPGYRSCLGGCIPVGGCCTAADCTTAPDVCHKLPGTCTLNQCQYALNDGALCDADGTKCTPNDRCVGGACQADTAHVVTCVPKDCNTAACNPLTGNCDYTPTSGTACGATGCYSAGTCAAGACSGTPKDCSAVSTTACTVPACDGTTGACVVANAPNGTPCTLADKCQVAVACSGGVCAGSPKTCVPSGPCASSECDAATGACVESALPVGTPCVGTDGCTLDGTCSATGACVGNSLPDGTPCELAASCTSGAAPACGQGRCACPGEPTPIDPGAKASSGCAMSPTGGPAWTLGPLFFLALVLARRRRGTRTAP